MNQLVDIHSIQRDYGKEIRGGASSRNSNPEGYGRPLAGDSEKDLSAEKKVTLIKKYPPPSNCIYRSTEGESRGSDVFTGAGD